MTRAEIIAALAAIEQAPDDRAEIWRVVIDEHGRETGRRIYRGSFQRDSRTAGGQIALLDRTEPHSRES